MAKRRHSDELVLDLHTTVKTALKREGVVNVPVIAKEMHEKHAQAGFSLNELEGQVLAAALALNAVILFQRPGPMCEWQRWHTARAAQRQC